MDPITAVALAGNILQFIQFVGGLLDDTRKLYASTTGTSDANGHIQNICSSLIRFHTELQEPSTPPASRIGQASRHGVPLAECAAACRRDCDDLLNIMGKLRTIGTKGTRCWSSFRVALAEVRKKSEIEDLRSRITDRQLQMTLLLCAASNESIQTLNSHVRDIGRGIWNADTNSRLDAMIAEIQNLKNRVSEQEEKKHATADDISSICGDFSKLSLETRAFEKEAAVLASLNYEDRPVRHEKIRNSYGKTLEWSLRAADEATEAKFGRMRNWLRAEDDLFWVSGKPGSGKSTFMKYIADNDETKKCLQAWAGTHELIVASHYFTIYGTPTQRSLDGLLRSLVFGILVQKPALISQFLEDRWDRPTVQPKWRQSELESLLRLLGAETGGMTSKICFFIDGLDEFEGDHIDICQTLKQLSQSPSIKVCVSSRPWNVFEDALGDKQDAKLYMHELTCNDIHLYSASRLQEHPRWNAMQEEASPGVLSSFVGEIVAKSNGVFLWVTLVVDQLREGLTNDDSLSDLQRRLSSFPADLERFFKHILLSVDPFYNEKMAGTLSLALHALEPLYLEIFFIHDLEYSDENYAFEEPVDRMATDLTDLYKMFSIVSRRINGRCKGLLERNGDRMVFLHRTVYDFLRTDEMTQFLKDQTKSSRNMTLSLLKAFIAWTKRSTFTRGGMREFDNPMTEINGFVSRLRQILPYARLADKQGESSAALTAALLDNMEHSITRMLEQGQLEMADPSLARGIFRQLVLEAGVGHYVRRKLAMDPTFFTGPLADRIPSPLRVVLAPSCKLTAEDQYWVLLKLLQSGCDPNHHPFRDPRAHQTHSPWSDFFTEGVIDTSMWVIRLSAFAENKTLLALVEHGADLAIVIPVLKKTWDLDLPVWLLFFLVSIEYVDSWERAKAYEEILVAMLSRCGPIGNTAISSRKEVDGQKREDAVVKKCTFWLVLKTLRDEFVDVSVNQFLVRIFACFLSRIPAKLRAFKEAEKLAEKVLPSGSASQLRDEISSMRSYTDVRLSKKRHMDDEPAAFAKRKRGPAKTPRRKPKPKRSID